MFGRKTVILFIIIGTLIVVASVRLLSKDELFEEPEIKITEAIYPETRVGTVQAIIEYTIMNKNSKSIRLTDVQIISIQGGFEVGSIIIKEILIDANSEIMGRIEMTEDWSMVPTFEPDLVTEYNVNAQIDNIGRMEKNHILPIPRQYIPTPIVEPEPGPPDEWLDEFYKNIRSGGPPKDGIPPIDNPEYISIEDADEILEDKDIVFVMETGDSFYVYPQRILVWHEIVNEEIDGVKYSLTYCPLTGSAIGYYGELKGIETSYGTSGKLINSNLVMYDRETDSYWPQILGLSIRGESKGESLDMFRVVWTSWELVKEKYPEAFVLSENTGFIRTYGHDPYGQYTSPDSYYNTGDPYFPVMHSDSRLNPKEVVVGIKIDGEPVAVSKKSVAEKRAINFNVEKTFLVAFYDEELDSVNVFNASHKNGVHSFIFQDNNLIDEDSGSLWLADGTCISGEFESSKLIPVDHFDVMWFGWVAYYPDTGLVADF